MFTSVFIANRGEIAIRIARAARDLGVRVVAGCSTVDLDSSISRMANQIVHIGPAPARRSYLNAGAVLQAALQSDAEAIHPGYGFLSEDADFAEACTAEGLTFIGPPPEVMRTLGDKSSARAAMAAVGIPLLPGAVKPVRDVEAARRLAREIGYPLIIKAVAGGGGRGMRVVTDAAQIDQAFQETVAHARILFGNGQVYLERYLCRARHVEVQVLADRHGNCVHLGERDCSVQRRHQKLIEESPAPGLLPGLTDRICQAAVRGALATGYVGAGTFEFLVDEHGDFYFMEVNCRIQVEHPVTEMVTGLDLVQQQFRIAAGERLALDQARIGCRGVAIECRINAEDPARGFIPTPGLIERYAPPGGAFVRVDTHVYSGYRVPSNYDSLLAKLIVWGADRAAAITRMRGALAELEVHGNGMHTTARYLDTVLADPQFTAAEHDTRLLERLA
jgi:acetyl-CoA carboxylase biotin carboxylase subunit